MTIDSTLNEIREKICQLRTAIMYSMCDDVCKLPNSIVTALRVDEEGQLWFLCQKPLQDVAEYEYSFPVRLHFYHKGIFFHVEVSGKATIVEDDYSGYIPAEVASNGKLMLVKMSMNAIEYTEPYGRKEQNRLEALIEKGYKWITGNLAFPHTAKEQLSKNAV